VGFHEPSYVPLKFIPDLNVEVEWRAASIPRIEVDIREMEEGERMRHVAGGWFSG
jgi:hypothetical protein